VGLKSLGDSNQSQVRGHGGRTMVLQREPRAGPGFELQHSKVAPSAWAWAAPDVKTLTSDLLGLPPGVAT
jgi:hypothetical protein